MAGANVPAFPEQIRLENTNACNAACVICPREKMTRPVGFMDDALLDRILEEVKGKGITKFTLQGYGEPLLDKRFCEHMRRIKSELDCPTFTVSNGSCITPALADELVACGLDKIKISLYGTSKAEYEAVHKPLKYERVVQGIDTLARAKRAAGSTMVIRVQYIGKWWRFVPFCLRWMGKVKVGYNTLHNYGDGRAYRRPRGGAARCPMLAQPVLQVLWNGDVVPCCYDFDGKMDMGNVLQESIESIWHGERYTALREANAAADFSAYPVCLRCDRRR